MSALRGAWKGRQPVFGGDVGRKAIIVNICRGCGLWHEGKKPAQCLSCGRMDFDRFDSKKEAKRWATLNLLARAGEIAELERQVPFDLLTIDHRTGKPVKWATYVCDFRYRLVATSEQVVEDVKPEDRITPDAALKLRCMEASGRTVTLV